MTPSTSDFLEVVASARWVADQVLAPAAEQTDQAVLVPRSNLDALARAGLFGIACAHPGAGEGPPRQGPMRQVQELLAGACGATYFVWAQHHSPVRMLQATSNAALADRWLEPLCRGEQIAGVAFAYLRRPGPPALSAERTSSGWRVNGTAPFVTSWGLADAFLVAAVSAAGELVWFWLPGRATDSVLPSPPLALSVLQATSTVALRLADLWVPDGQVVRVEALDTWRARDRAATARPPAAALGLAERCCRLLAGLASERGRAVEDAASSLAGELDRCRAHAYALADALPGTREELPVDTAVPDQVGQASSSGGASPGGGAVHDLDSHLAAMVEARAWCLDLAQRSSLALVAAVGGRAMTLSHPAQRLAREAAFYSVQAQTGAIRAAALSLLSRPIG